jgi:hypothetical protein
MPTVASTSGRLHSEFVRLLFLQAHRETDRFFTVSGVLEVVESPETTGPITGGSLSSLRKFRNYEFIHMGSPRPTEIVNRYLITLSIRAHRHVVDSSAQITILFIMNR